MATLLLAAAFLACLTALAVYIAGGDFLVFGIAAGLAIFGGWWLWIGAAVAVAQAARLSWRKWSGRQSDPIAD